MWGVINAACYRNHQAVVQLRWVTMVGAGRQSAYSVVEVGAVAGSPCFTCHGHLHEIGNGDEAKWG